MTSPLRFTLFAPDTVRRGEAVLFTMRVENTGTRAVDLELRGREPTLSVTVVDQRQREVWRSAADPVPASLLLLTVNPGAPIETSILWDQRDSSGSPVRAGNYLAEATLLTDGPVLPSASCRLRID